MKNSKNFFRFTGLVISLVLSLLLFSQENLKASELSFIPSNNALRQALPSASEDELRNLNRNLSQALSSIKSTTSIVENIYTPGTQTYISEVPVSDNIVLKVIDTNTISAKQTRSGKAYTLERTSTHIVKDALLPVESFRFNLSCSYEYDHATDISCSDVSPSYSSTALGVLYNLSYSDINKGNTGLTAWGKATYNAKIQIAGNFGITIHNMAVTGKISVIPTEYDTGGWYFNINEEWI